MVTPTASICELYFPQKHQKTKSPARELLNESIHPIISVRKKHPSRFSVMFPRFLHIIAAYCRQNPMSFRLATAAIVLALVTWAALEFFKPLGKRTAKNGIKPRLPPGPPGVPLLGSLWDFIRQDGDSVKIMVRQYSWLIELECRKPRYLSNDRATLIAATTAE